MKSLQEVCTGDTEDGIFHKPFFSAVEQKGLALWIFLFESSKSVQVARMYRFCIYDLPVPRGPKRKKLDFGGWKYLSIISILRLKMELLASIYYAYLSRSNRYIKNT
jgi:hypothetical protein